MAGHNKWSQIKRKKGVEDAKRSKLFAMLGRAITLESRKATGNKESPGLKKAIENARKENMPNDNIDRAIAKGMGAGAESFEEVLYEAYGPGGAALIIEGMTDSKNRTNQEIKHILSDHGGSLGGPGSVTWGFRKTESGWKSTMPLEIPESDMEKLAELIEKLEEHADVKNVFTNINEED